VAVPLQFPQGEWNLDTPLSLLVFTRLQQLRLQLDDNALLPHLAHCRQLRVLQLFFVTRDIIRTEPLCAIVAANAATLEELRFSCDNFRGYSLASALREGAKCASHWSVFALCVRLRVLELSVDSTLASHVPVALATLPGFQSLELTLLAPPPRYSQETALLWLPVVLSSVSWCSVRLRLPVSDASVLSVCQLTKTSVAPIIGRAVPAALCRRAAPPARVRHTCLAFFG
jgi:hypothetical protein